MEKKTKIIIGVSGLIVGYVLFKNIKASIDKKKATKILNRDSDTTKGLNFYNLADDLFEAMDGYGTANQVIYDSFAKLNNNFDLDSLIKAYSSRTLSSGAFNPQPNFTGDLVSSLKNELSGSELATLNQILTSKGIRNI